MNLLEILDIPINILSSKINSKALRFYNFSSGSNLSKDLIELIIKIINLYKDEGYLDVKTSYSLEKNNFGNYKLTFL